MQSTENHSLLPSLISFLIRLFQSDPALALDLIYLVRRLKERWHGDTSIYEVLKLNIQLELCDTSGKKAIYNKQQQVRFLQNNVIAYQDQAWGDGDIFADYQCSPGIEVDRYREGHRYRILISLRETKKRGEVSDLLIRRMIRDGFTQEVEELQTEIDHPTRQLSIQIIFPENRLPKQISLYERNSKRTTVLDANNIRVLPDKRRQITWEHKTPRRYEIYIMRWQW